MRSLETLMNFNAEEIKEEKKKIEEYINSPDFNWEYNRDKTMSKLKEYLFFEAMEDPKWDPAKAQQAYDEIDKDVEIKSHLDFIYDNLLADETIKELKNDRVKKLAYGETLYSEDEKKTSIKWGKEFRAFIRKNTYQDYEQRLREELSEAEPKKIEPSEEMHEKGQKEAYTFMCKNLKNFANEMEEMVKSVDYFMFGKGSPEFDKMKDKIVSFRKYVEDLPKELDTETAVECLDRLNTVKTSIQTYVRKKQKDLKDDPDRIKDPDKQKREQPRIKTSIEMLEKAEMFYHKGKCGLVGRVYGELAPKLEAELKFEENFRADTAKMQDKSRFMDSAARTIRMLQEMDGSKYLPSESMDTFYTNRKEQSKSAMNDVCGYSWLDTKDFTRFEAGVEPKSRMECTLRDISNWYDENKGNINKENCLTTDKIRHILAVNEIGVKPAHHTISERYALNVKTTETACAKYRQNMINAPEKAAAGLGI